MRIAAAFFLCSSLSLSALAAFVPPAGFRSDDAWTLQADQWSRKEATISATISKGMTRAELVTVLGDRFSAKTKDNASTEVLRYYRNVAEPRVRAFEGATGFFPLRGPVETYDSHEDRVEVILQSGIVVDVVVTRGPDRRHWLG